MVEVVRAGTVAEYNRYIKTITWTGLLTTDSGIAVELPRYADKTVHIFGTFAGATVTMYGSNDPLVVTDRNAGTLFGSKTASWVQVSSTQNPTIAVTSAALLTIIEDPIYMLPVVTGGDGTTSLKVIICCRRAY